MIALERDDKTPRYVPDYMANAITDIDFVRLKREGIKYVAFDADSTLVNYKSIELAPSTLKYLKKQRKLFRKWCIASNRIIDNLEPLAASFDAGVIRANWFVRKPDIKFFDRVLKYFEATPEEVVMIGDKLFADIYGAKRAGFKTLWVEHLGRDSLIDRITQIRHFEKRFLKRYKP